MNFQCLSCGGKKFQTKSTKIDTELRGQALSLEVDGLVCEQCGQVLMDTQMMSHLQMLASDEFRRMNGLLPSAIIRQYREDLKLTQNEFAEFLGVGVASVKRWEGSGIQEKSHDELIRIKCDLHYAQKNAETLETMLNTLRGTSERLSHQISDSKANVSILNDYSPVNRIRLEA